jgi:DNA polymerase-3 subunit alpha
MEMTLPDLESEEERGPVVISLPVTRCVPPVVDRLKEVLSAHPGTVEVHLQLQSGGRTTVMRLDDRLRVRPSPALFGDVKALLGQSSVA